MVLSKNLKTAAIVKKVTLFVIIKDGNGDILNICRLEMFALPEYFIKKLEANTKVLTTN